MNMPAAVTLRSDEQRIEAAIRREGRRRLGVITWARSLAMLVVAAIVATVAPWPEMLYYQALIALFALFGVVQYFIGRSRWSREWHPYLFIVLDMALLVFTLLYPNPFAPGFFPPQFSLRFNNFLYLFLVIGVLSISLRPALSLWAGIWGAGLWAIGVWWMTTLPGADFERVSGRPLDDAETRIGLIERILQPGFIDLGVQFQNIVVLLTVSATLAVASAASRRLLLRETAQARRVANLSRYLPSEAIGVLAARNDPFSEERQEDVAVLFTDVVSFSAWAENREAQEVIGMLREVHALVARCVFDHHGVLDKFIGDGAMATFGVAPRTNAADVHPAVDALACTRAIIAAMAAFNEGRHAVGQDAIHLSVGVHYGPVIIGDVGSQRRMELAVIGDTVNVAARLETITRQLGVQAAVSEEVLHAANQTNGFENLGPHVVKGRAEPVTIWALR
ncbi:MAG: adenylate/guanylate cyclase domain-containing protein [Pseudomonadota bacterium]